MRKQLAIVLADKVEQGQFTVEQAIAVAESILYLAPKRYWVWCREGECFTVLLIVFFFSGSFCSN